MKHIDLLFWVVGEESDCCRWAGITCDNITRHVHRIHLPGLDGHCKDYYNSDKEREEASKQRLRGNLSSSLWYLKQLRHLDLSCNDFGMSRVPKFIGSLGNLRYLNLSDSNFVEMIPPQLRNLSELNVLYLGSSYFTYEYTSMMNMNRLSSLRMLRHLDLSGVDLSKAIDWLQLDVSNNQLGGSLPNSISQLSKMTHFSFSSNNPTGVVAENHFVKLVSLKYLSGEGNNLILRLRSANWIPPFQLQSLGLNSWVLGPQFPLWLQSQTDLDVLRISNTSISSRMPSSFWRSFPKLRFLDMSQNNIQGMLSNVLATLISLDLSYNKFSGRLPHLSNDSILYSLDLSNNDFEGSLHHLSCPYESNSVAVLDLGNNHLLGVIPDCWEKLQALLFLNLENNNFSGGDVPNVISSDLLVMKGREDTYSTILRLKSADRKRIPEKIGNMKALVSYDLSLNKLYGELPMSLSSLSLLSSFNVSYNNLSWKSSIKYTAQTSMREASFATTLWRSTRVNKCARVEAPAPDTNKS
ncbi:leucine-rich repeat protein [Tanacetum coccineum]